MRINMAYRQVSILSICLSLLVFGCQSTTSQQQQTPPPVMSSPSSSTSTASLPNKSSTRASSSSQTSSTQQQAQQSSANAKTSPQSQTNSSSQQQTAKHKQRGKQQEQSEHTPSHENTEQAVDAETQVTPNEQQPWQDPIADPQQNKAQEIDFSEEDQSAQTSNETTQQSSNSTATSNSTNVQVTGQSSTTQDKAQRSGSTNASAESKQAKQQTAKTNAGVITHQHNAKKHQVSRVQQVAKLDEKLNSSMADYDGMILTEREYVQRQGQERGSEQEVENIPAGALYDDVLNGEADSSKAQVANNTDDTSSGRGNMPMPSQTQSGEFKHNKAVFAPPADIPSGDDDDVVAKQIREAAMSETDPKLREKLWQEYRKYKNSGGQ